MGTWTKEPWKILKYANFSGVVGEGADPDDDHVVDATDDANADRIVVCVNACAGIEDPARALAAAREHLRAMLEYVDTTRMQRDIGVVGGFAMSKIGERARAALALLEGQGGGRE